MDFSDKHVLVTGASSGIGAALCTKLADDGAHVSALARRLDRLESLATSSQLITPIKADVCDTKAVKHAVRKAKEKSGAIDIAILNAGIYTPVDASSWSNEVFRHHMEVNYLGIIHLLGEVLPDMLARQSGHIALMASVAGYRGLPRSAAYGPSKAAIQNLAESLYFDVHPKGIKIQLINPGFVQTEATAVNDFEMPGLMTAQDAASKVVAGLDSSRFEISFPFGFSRVMKALSVLPANLYLPLVARLTAGSKRR